MKVARRIAKNNSFESVARRRWASWKVARSSRHAEYVERRLDADVFPVIGHRPIADLEAAELVAMVKRIEAQGVLDIAKRSMQTCGQVFRYAIAQDIRIPRKGNIQGEVIEGAFRVLEEFDAVEVHAEGMKAVALNPPEELAFATAALALRFGFGEVTEGAPTVHRP